MGRGRDGTVTLTAFEYRLLVDAHVRLNILRKRRLAEIEEGTTCYVSSDDYVLGDDVVAKAKEKASC